MKVIFYSISLFFLFWTSILKAKAPAPYEYPLWSEIFPHTLSSFTRHCPLNLSARLDWDEAFEELIKCSKNLTDTQKMEWRSAIEEEFWQSNPQSGALNWARAAFVIEIVDALKLDAINCPSGRFLYAEVEGASIPKSPEDWKNLDRSEVPLVDFEAKGTELWFLERPIDNGKWIEWLYRNSRKTYNETERRVATKYIGRTRRQLKTPGQIASFSQSLGIPPAEVLLNKCRSASSVFGQPFWQYKNENEWFARDLTETARKDFLSETTLHPEVVAASPAHSRLRMKEIAAHHLQDPQDIVGKVFTESEAEKARLNGDNSLYYSKDYLFSWVDLLGVDRALKNKGSVFQGEKMVLEDLFHYYNSRPTRQFIFRLSPADVHHFAMPVDGKIMNPTEIATFLGNTKAIQLLKAKEKKLKRPLSTSIEISGKIHSVSTQAIQYQSNILGINERKILMIEHNDGKHSLHVFVGATLVNKVFVQTEKGFYHQGHDLGRMEFGDEEVGKSCCFDSKKKLKLGLPLGHFTPDGSTIISLYEADDYDLYPTLESLWNKTQVEAKKLLGHEIELKLHLGQPLLQKKK